MALSTSDPASSPSLRMRGARWHICLRAGTKFESPSSTNAASESQERIGREKEREREREEREKKERKRAGCPSIIRDVRWGEGSLRFLPHVFASAGLSD